jgi:hypothetical protein
MQLLSGSANTFAQYVTPRVATPGFDLPCTTDEVAQFGANAPAHTALAQACGELGLRTNVDTDAWSLGDPSGRSVGVLVLIHADRADEVQIHLAQTCRAFGACRVVLVGPGFGTEAAETALVSGFDEVWPSALPHPLFVALLQRAWHTATQLLASDSATALQVGPLIVGRHHEQCTYHDRTILLGKDSWALLKVLVAQYPKPIERDTLIDALGKAGLDFAPRSRAVDMAIARLRQRLQAAEIHDVQVSTVRGVGYSLVVW